VTDLLNNPDAERVSPVRGVPQPILAKTPRTGNGTTNSGVCEGGGYSENQWELRRRRVEVQNITSPPEDPVARAWRLHEEHWKAREDKWKEDERRKQAAIRAEAKAQQERTQREIERLKMLREYKLQEQLLNGVFEEHSLSATERRYVNQKLCDAGRPQDLEMATILSQRIVLERSTNPIQSSVDDGLDWRGVLRK
jgi:hypothetical protein